MRVRNSDLKNNAIMPDLEKTLPGRSWRRQRDTSGPTRPTTRPLGRLYSGQHLDDHSYYHHDDHDEYLDDDSRSTLAKDDLEDQQSEEGSVKREGEEAKEVRDGIPDELDLESRGAPLEKGATTRSVMPENLVDTACPQVAYQVDSKRAGDLGWT